MKRIILLAVLMLVAAACGETSPAPSTTVATTAAAGDEAAGSDDTMTDDTMTDDTMTDDGHDDDEATHDDDGHDDDEATHDDDGHDDDVDADRVIEITMSEFAFSPTAVELHAGETVLFEITNEGVVEHEFRLSNEHRIDEHLESGHEGHGDDDGAEGTHHDEDGDVLVLVPAGETGELTVTFTEDTTLYTMIVCLIPGHYEAGMNGSLAYETS